MAALVGDTDVHRKEAITRASQRSRPAEPRAAAERPGHGTGSTVVPNTLSDGVRVATAPREGFLTAELRVDVPRRAAVRRGAAFLMANPALQQRIVDNGCPCSSASSCSCSRSGSSSRGSHRSSRWACSSLYALTMGLVHRRRRAGLRTRRSGSRASCRRSWAPRPSSVAPPSTARSRSATSRALAASSSWASSGSSS